MITDTAFMLESVRWPGLAKLMEECGELIQVGGKIIAMQGAENYDHWDGTDVRVRLTEEMGDVRAAMIFLTTHSANMSKEAIHSRAADKLRFFEKVRNG